MLMVCCSRTAAPARRRREIPKYRIFELLTCDNTDNTSRLPCCASLGNFQFTTLSLTVHTNTPLIPARDPSRVQSLYLQASSRSHIQGELLQANNGGNGANDVHEVRAGSISNSF